MNERKELHRVIQKINDDLRGAVCAWDFKAYVLGTLFYRYISENITSYINEKEKNTGKNDFDYTTLNDETAALTKDIIIKEKGFFILPSELFCNVQKNSKRGRIIICTRFLYVENVVIIFMLEKLMN